MFTPSRRPPSTTSSRAGAASDTTAAPAPLHRAAQQIVAEHGGALPATAAELRGLSGIGPYTAGAVASIAFDAPEPLVDGNVARVLARTFGIDLDTRSSEAQRLFWETAATLVTADPAVPPSVLNQALMELGALVCSPLRPACGVCRWLPVLIPHAA